MGLGSRPYWREPSQGGGGPAWLGGMRFHWERPTRAVLGLMIACGALFVLPALLPGGWAPRWLALRAGEGFQAWRLVTFQFLHDGPAHLFFNLLGLYFFGPPLEREWGGGRFLAFYLGCGAAAGAAFLLLALGAPAGVRPALVGASGGALACVAACAVQMPWMNILLIRIRWATAILLAVYGLSVATALANRGYAAIGDAAHLGGMLTGGAWALLSRRRGGVLGGVRRRLKRGAWLRRQKEEARRQGEVDRILDKIHRQGIGSLSARERRTLQEETRRQRQRTPD